MHDVDPNSAAHTASQLPSSPLSLLFILLTTCLPLFSSLLFIHRLNAASSLLPPLLPPPPLPAPLLCPPPPPPRPPPKHRFAWTADVQKFLVEIAHGRRIWAASHGTVTTQWDGIADEVSRRAAGRVNTTGRGCREKFEALCREAKARQQTASQRSGMRNRGRTWTRCCSIATTRQPHGLLQLSRQGSRMRRRQRRGRRGRQNSRRRPCKA